jgi:hypothetical protein
MKVSKKVWLIIGGIILIVALVGLYTVYSGQAQERGNLNERLSEAQKTRLPTLTKQKQDLENQLASAQSLLEASQAQFPESVESIEYDDDLFEIAADCNVDISKITASPPTSRTVGAVTYPVSSFVMDVSGSVDDILTFINAVRTGEDFQLPWSAEVMSINIDVAGSAATITVNIYGYKG